MKTHLLPQEGEAERFWKFVDKRGPDECWPYTGATTSGGYGWFVRNGGKSGIGAHVFAFMLANGFVPAKGMQVLHTCDNPPCVNTLAHHFYGDNGDNMRDMQRKNRRRGAMPPRRAGAMNPRARLNDAQVAEIRRLWANRGFFPLTQAELARRFGVGHSRISAIVRNQTYVVGLS